MRDIVEHKAGEIALFTTVIVQPIFNLLVLILNIIPGHNFGLAIIIFTIIIRILMWPLVRKQLHHAKAIRALQPELKKIKAAAKGNRQEESKLTMELYKERQINPFASLGIVLVQAPILIGLYIGLNKVIKDPHELVSLSYSFLQFGWLHNLAHNIGQFDETLFGAIDLTRKATGPKGIYWPGLVLVAAAAISQFYQSKQLMPSSADARGLRKILKEAGAGVQADQSEVTAAVGRSTMFLIPFFVFIVGLNLAAALPLYWLISSLVALFQQSRVLREDVAEAEAVVAKSPQPAKVTAVDTSRRLIKQTKTGVKVYSRTLSDQSPTKKKRRKR